MGVAVGRFVLQEYPSSCEDPFLKATSHTVKSDPSHACLGQAPKGREIAVETG